MQSEKLKKVEVQKLVRKTTGMKLAEELQSVQLKKVNEEDLHHFSTKQTNEQIAKAKLKPNTIISNKKLQEVAPTAIQMQMQVKLRMQLAAAKKKKRKSALDDSESESSDSDIYTSSEASD